MRVGLSNIWCSKRPEIESGRPGFSSVSTSNLSLMKDGSVISPRMVLKLLGKGLSLLVHLYCIGDKGVISLDGWTFSALLLLEMTQFLLGHWTRRKGLGYPLRSDSSFGSSLSHTTTDSYLNYSGVRKVKVNKARGSDNGILKEWGTSTIGKATVFFFQLVQPDIRVITATFYWSLFIIMVIRKSFQWVLTLIRQRPVLAQ